MKNFTTIRFAVKLVIWLGRFWPASPILAWTELSVLRKNFTKKKQEDENRLKISILKTEILVVQ